MQQSKMDIDSSKLIFRMTWYLKIKKENTSLLCAIPKTAWYHSIITRLDFPDTTISPMDTSIPTSISFSMVKSIMVTISISHEKH
mmetsp:Transcript_5293/g.7398  ORF Transcript_5293/g.7398 Transcript_5293/m.7398 type:complete len:85 (-) Transcript_5293:419-673(-)